MERFDCIGIIMVVKVGSIKATELQTKGRHKSGQGGEGYFLSKSITVSKNASLNTGTFILA